MVGAMQPDDALRLVPHRVLKVEPEIWIVRLRDGRAIEVMAHAWTLDGDDCVFSLLFEGQPAIEAPVLRIPRDLLVSD